MATIDLIIPDIGNFDDVDVIEIPVNVGDIIAIDDTLLTLESDKASMDVPAEKAGKIVEILVKVGGSVKMGSPFMRIEEASSVVADKVVADKAPIATKNTNEASSVSQGAPSKEAIEGISVPDIGNFDDVSVIDILVNVGDVIKFDQALLTLESDKASMDIPADKAGKITEILVSIGDKIKEGDLILKVATHTGTQTAVEPVENRSAPESTEMNIVGKTPEKTLEKNPDKIDKEISKEIPTEKPALSINRSVTNDMAKIDFPNAYASPSVRAFARELGANLNQITGSGRKERILREDVIHFVKNALSGAISPATPASEGARLGWDLLPWPKIDFTQFGDIEKMPLSRVKKISGANLARNWAMIPHVTQFEDADITELEALRKSLNKEYEKEGARVTMLAFLVKACVKALQQFPEVNSSIDGDQLILKKYYHIGFAADTPNGLVVPVIRDSDKKGVLEIATEMSELAKLARDGKLKLEQMQGGTFTISSLGGIGGTAFTPIVNAPEVAILGVSRNEIKPVWNGKEFLPRMILPLSLSYDHRVVDGALGARFIVYLSQLLADMRRVII